MRKLILNIGLSFILLFISLHDAISQPLPNATKVNFETILSNPQIVQEFDKLKSTAENAEIVQKNGKPYLAESDIQKLNTITNNLLKILKVHEHLIPKQYKAHTYIGKNQSNSCYQYYNSLVPESIGKSCSEFPKSFSNCDECNKYIEALKTIKENHILHSHWWKEELITSFVKTIKLKNGDEAYVGFELTPKH